MPDTDTLPTEPVPGNPAAQWAKTDPSEVTNREQSIGLPRLVCETHARLGANATPAQVATELIAAGIDTTVDDVKACWPEGGKLSG